MKGKVLVPLLLIILIASMFIANPSFSITISKEQCRTMIQYGDKALLDGDYEIAKSFYRRALQYDPYSINAWKKYEAMIQVVTQGKEIDLSGLKFYNPEATNSVSETKISPSENKKALEEESEGGFIFQGC